MLEKKVFNQCIIPTLTYGCQTWTLTKELVHNLKVCQSKMERKILGIKQIEKVPNRIIREKTGVNDILEVLTKTRVKWAGHVARMKDNRWTIRCTEWQVRNGRRSRGRPKSRWRDDLQQWQGVTWSRAAKDRQQWRDLAEGCLRHWREIP